MAKVLQMSDGDGNVYPVGAVFGSNSDGSYTKFADGTLICWKVLSFTGLAINTAWGGVYENTNALNLGNWPVAFTATPTIFVSNAKTSGSVSAFAEQVNGTSTTAVGTTYVWCPKSHASAAVGIAVLGIGRWK